MLALVDAGRLTAISAMATAPSWPEMAGELRARRDRVAVGLHLDLTWRPFDGERPPFDHRALILSSLGRRLDVAAIAAEFERQFDLFENALGAAPDHVDGHHHAHALPQARDALLAVLQRRYGAVDAELRPVVRAPGDAIGAILRRRCARGKALIVASLSAGFAARVAAAGFAANRGFSGFSPLDGRRPFAEEFPEFLKALGPRHLVMCHPGFADEPGGRVGHPARREEEYATLMRREDLLAAMTRVDRPKDRPGGAFAGWGAPISRSGDCGKSGGVAEVLGPWR